MKHCKRKEGVGHECFKLGDINNGAIAYQRIMAENISCREEKGNQNCGGGFYSSWDYRVFYTVHISLDIFNYEKERFKTSNENNKGCGNTVGVYSL